MAAANTDLFMKVGNPGTATTLSSPGYSIGNTSITVGSTANFPTDTGVVFSIDTYEVVNNEEVRVDGSYCVFAGVVASGTSITNLDLLYGTPQDYASGAATRVYITVSSEHTNRLVQGILEQHNQDGSHGDVTAESITVNGTVTADEFVVAGSSGAGGWLTGLPVPNTVTYNGNRSYDLVFNGDDLTDVLSNGMRLRTTRTVTAPTQCTSLNGTSQYFSKTSPAGMTFTDDFTAGTWVKLDRYPSGVGVMQSRFSGSSGWRMSVGSDGRVYLSAFNGALGNYSEVVSYQSVPLNKWVHIAAQLDMSAYTATPTTSYIMFDGQDIPATVARSGTNPTSLTQAGSYEIGSNNGGTQLFPGKIAQAAIFNAKVTQATMRGYISQGLAGTETSLISAYSFNNSINDLNTTNANNLTANGSAVATNADSPFTQDDTGTPSGTNDFAIITSKTFSTNTTLTVQVPEGCTIPTSGGVSSVVYSSNSVPYGFPRQEGRWNIEVHRKITDQQLTPTTGTWYNPSTAKIDVPIGSWNLGYEAALIVGNNTNLPHITGSLSTSPSSESDADLSTVFRASVAASNSVFASVSRSKGISVSAATTYYGIIKSGQNSTANIEWGGSQVTTVFRAKLAYL